MLKQWSKKLIPESLKVPMKYFYSTILGHIELELKLLPWLIKPNDRTIDVGGNWGIYTYKMWRMGAYVDVFEPNPVCYRVLSAWAMGKIRVKLHDVALSDRDGWATLNIPVDASGIEHDSSGSLEIVDFASVRNEQVAVRTLDSYAFENIKFIKVDVEGHEFNVLRSAEKLLCIQRPSLLVEIEQRHCQHSIFEVFNLMDNWGYKGYYLNKGHLMPLLNFDIDRDQNIENLSAKRGSYINNFLFLHQEAIKEGEYVELFREWNGE